MRSKYFNILILLAAILAFVPPLVVGYFVDGYTRERMTAQMQRSVDAIGAEIETNANDAVLSLQRVLAASPSLCTPTFIANVHNAMRASLYLRDVTVENGSGTQYCSAFGSAIGDTPLSGTLSIPGHVETFSVVRREGLDTPLLKITRAYGADRNVSALVPLLSGAPALLLPANHPMTRVLIALTGGQPVLTLGDVKAFTPGHSFNNMISVTSFAGEIPLHAEIDFYIGADGSNLSTLRFGFTLGAGLLAAGLLVLLLHYVRRSSLPAFDLERAIAIGELKPFYQPVIDLASGRLLGCEVLCRWVRKNGQIVSPGAFIDYAEATNLAIPMTISLMQQVRSDLGELCREMPTLKVSINLFEGHFRNRAIVDDVQAIFGPSPISFTQLTFEITERRPLGNSRQSQEVIEGLHALGCKLALDDVGTGHSNLAYLQTLGVDILKIDHVFVDMVKTEASQVPVLDGLIIMARDLGTEVVAEGVETEAQALYLRARGVVQAQGFLFAPALQPKTFKELAHALNVSGEAELDAVAA